MEIDIESILKDIQEKSEAIRASAGESLVGLDEDHDLLLANGVMLEAIAKVLAFGVRPASREELKEFNSMYTEFKDLFSEIME